MEVPASGKREGAQGPSNRDHDAGIMKALINSAPLLPIGPDQPSAARGKRPCFQAHPGSCLQILLIEAGFIFCS